MEELRQRRLSNCYSQAGVNRYLKRITTHDLPLLKAAKDKKMTIIGIDKEITIEDSKIYFAFNSDWENEELHQEYLERIFKNRNPLMASKINKAFENRQCQSGIAIIGNLHFQPKIETFYSGYKGESIASVNQLVQQQNSPLIFAWPVSTRHPKALQGFILDKSKNGNIADFEILVPDPSKDQQE